MMTMFILFLSMFVYQMADDDFLEPVRQEIIGGDTTEALQATDSSGASFPFAPISPSLPLMTAGTIKKVERVPLEELKEEVEQTPDEFKFNRKTSIKVNNSIAIIVDKDLYIPPPLSQQPLPIPSDTVLQPRPLIPEEPTS